VLQAAADSPRTFLPVVHIAEERCYCQHEIVLFCFAEEFALAGLFGAFPLDATNNRGEQMMIHGVDDVGTWNEMGKVFPTAGFKQLFEQYKESYLQGAAHIFPATYEVR
jgi:hypothetical protein